MLRRRTTLCQTKLHLAVKGQLALQACIQDPNCCNNLTLLAAAAACVGLCRQTFWALMLDLPTIRSCLEARPRPLLTLFPLSSLTSERVDAAFLTACSIGAQWPAVVT